MNIEEIKSVNDDAIRISNCFKKYSAYTADSSCDKHGIGFNLDYRFSGAGRHELTFDSWVGYYGNSDCSSTFSISSKNHKLFWRLFDRYINLHKEEIFEYISNGFNEEIKLYEKTITDEISKLNELLEDIKQDKTK